MDRSPAVSARRVDVGGVALAVIEAGIGGRPLLAVHGFTGAKEDFAEVLAPLAGRGWHAVSVDLRGHGSSDAPAGQQHYSFEILADEVTTLIGALGWPSCTLVGHSMGGILAQRVALERPDLVDALVLVDSFCGPVGGIEMALVELGSSIVRKSGMPALAEALTAYRSQHEGGVPVEEVERSRPGHADYVRSKLLATSPDLWVALAPAFLTLEPWCDRLAGVVAPTAVIVGEHDQASRPDSERMAAAIPGARLTVIAGAGHSPQFETPSAWEEALMDFLDGLDGVPTDSRSEAGRAGAAGPGRAG